jgi:hypothetical protein
VVARGGFKLGVAFLTFPATLLWGNYVVKLGASFGRIVSELPTIQELEALRKGDR